MLVTVDLGDAAKFATYDESTNTLRLHNADLLATVGHRHLADSIEDGEDYRILLTARRDENDQHPIKKYLHIRFTGQNDVEGRADPSFKADLTPFEITLGQQ